MERLIELGADVSYNDPFIPRLPLMRHYNFEGMTSHELTPEYLGSLTVCWFRQTIPVTTGPESFDSHDSWWIPEMRRET